MRDGTILLYRIPLKGATFLQKAIGYFTQQPYDHAAVFYDGSTLEENARGYEHTLGVKIASEYWEPEEEMTGLERTRATVFVQVVDGMGIRHHWPYNYLLTAVLAIVYPTRWFWNKIGWVPFASTLLGANCSSFVDRFWRYAGRDIKPKWMESLSAPGDLWGLRGFHLVEKILTKDLSYVE